MSNGQNTRILQFEETDAPVLVHALIIAANTALMCGKPLAQKRLQQLRKALEQFVPEPAKDFDPEDWCEMGLAMVSAERVHVFYDVPDWARTTNTWMREKNLRITIGKRSWCSEKRYGTDPDGPREALVAVLEEIVPLGCHVFPTSPESVDTPAEAG